jgi:predicted O-methyltransferase YrrM
MSNHITYIDSLVKIHKWKTGAELGVREGNFTYYLLKYNPDLNMIAIDLWDEHEDVKGSFNHSNNYKEAMEKFINYPDRVRVLRLLTTEAYKQFPDKYFDFIFIDASHDYNSCKLDIQNWYHKIKDNGFITGHDYHPKFGVKKVVDEVCNKFERGGDQDTTWVCKKEDINLKNLFTTENLII